MVAMEKQQIPYYVIDIIYKTVKLSYLKKSQIIQNMRNVMFQVIFIFSDWILIEQIIFSSTPFCCIVQVSTHNTAQSFSQFG